MCWSTEVSLRFASLDTFFVSVLVAKALFDKNLERRNIRLAYSALMACVAIQEWSQYGIWTRNRLALSSCTDAPDVLLSIMATGAAEALPFSLIATSFLTRQPHHVTVGYRSSIRRTAILLYVIQVMLVILSVVATKKYCVELGQNFHQVWICESATYQAGGYSLHHTVYWLYFLSAVYAAESLDMPLAERRRLQGFALLSAVVSVALYGKTLEACSIWCWSAFSLGLWLCLQECGLIEVVAWTLQKMQSNRTTCNTGTFTSIYRNLNE